MKSIPELIKLKCYSTEFSACDGPGPNIGPQSRSYKTLALFILFILTGGMLSAQISLPANTIAVQNFNSMSSSATAPLPVNWKMSSAGTGLSSGWTTGTNITATTQSANSGLPATGGAYNWATSAGTDRSIGFLTTASYASPNAVLAYYRNTGPSVTSVTIAYSIKRYVVGTTVPVVDLYYSTNGTSWTAVSGASTSAADFPSGAAAGSFSTPKTINKTATIAVALGNNADIYFRWVFTTGASNSQGLGLDNVAVFAGAATPVLAATLQDILQVDNGTPAQFNEGDVIRYKTVIKNTGTGDATGVQVTLPTPPANTTMVAGSVKTSAVAVDDNYTASFNTVLTVSGVAAGVMNNDVGIPTPTAVLSFGTTADATVFAPGASGITDAGGTITLNANGTFVYTPPTGFSGVDKFKYITGNGNLPNNDAVVSITVGSDITFTTTNADPACNGGSSGSITFNASGGNGTLQYSINGSAGPYQASNVFTGLAATTYNLAVKDAGGLIKTGTATLNNPAAIVVSGTISALTYTVAMTPSTFTKTGGTGTITWSASGLPGGVAINAATGQVSGTPTTTGSFTATITATDANGCTGSKTVSVSVSPKLTNDAYTAVGNTQLVADAHSAPATPFTSSASNIKTNDQSDAAITVTAVTNAATTAGGTITIDAAGKFIYTPPNGSTTADSYTYTATSNGVSATATINFTISSMVWYVNNTYGGANGAANGSSHRPYTDLTTASAAAQVNQIIYVHTGSNNTSGNATLKSGQTLRGAGSALSVGTLTIAAGTKPTLSGTITLASNVTADGFDMNTGVLTAITSTSATGVNVDAGNIITSSALNAVSLTSTAGTITIAGGTQTNSTGASFNISGGSVSLTYGGSISQASNAAMVSISGGHSTGTITFNTGTLGATNGTGLQFDNADGTYNFNGTVTLNGGDAGIDILNASSGTFSFGSGVSITNPTNEVIKITSSTANVTYSGSFTKNNNAVNGIFINAESGGTIAINGSGTKSLSTSTANAVNLTSNTGATINFSGNNLSLTTTSGIGFNAASGGTVSVAGTGNTISSTTGSALNVSGTTISPTGLTFRSISSNGAANGILLSSTGSSGGLTVTGNGSSGTGGTIQNCTVKGGNFSNCSNINLSWMNFTANGADQAAGSTCGDLGTGPGFNTTCSANIVFQTVNAVSLTSCTFNNSVQEGINGNAVSNFSMTSCTVSGNGNSVFEQGMKMGNLSGTCAVTNCTFSNNYSRQIEVQNYSGTLTLTISGSSFTMPSFVSTNAQGVLLSSHNSGTSITATVTSCQFTNTFSAGFWADTQNGGTANVTVGNDNTASLGNTFTNCGYAIQVAISNNDQMTFDIGKNTFTEDALVSGATPVVVRKGSNSTAVVNGKVMNNTWGNSITGSGSGCSACNGLSLQDDGTSGGFNVTVTGNLFSHMRQRGIEVLPGLSDDVKVIITNNTFSNPDGTIGEAIFVQSGSSSTNTTRVCATITGNIINGNWNTGNPAAGAIRVRNRFPSTKFSLIGYSGSGSDVNAVAAYLASVNTMNGNTATASINGNTFDQICPF